MLVVKLILTDIPQKTDTWLKVFSRQTSEENFSDGLAVTELLMAAYMSAEQDKTIQFPPEGLEDFVPAVAKGEWNPNK